MTPAIKSIELPGRVRLPYVEQGDPSGVPMILLHGVTDCWRSFELVLPPLPASIRAFAVTQRGHGDAERPAALQTTFDLCELGESMRRAQLRREHPDATDEEIEALLIAWPQTRPGAEYGDSWGRPISWPPAARP